MAWRQTFMCFGRSEILLHLFLDVENSLPLQSPLNDGFWVLSALLLDSLDQTLHLSQYFFLCFVLLPSLLNMSYVELHLFEFE